MANPNAPHGFAPVQTGDASPWTGKARLYHIPSTDTNPYYIGDVVKTTGQTTGSDAYGVPDVIRVAVGAQTSVNVRGVLVGVMAAGVNTQGFPVGTPNLNTIVIPATKTSDYYVWVIDDPSAEFEIVGDNTTTLNPATGGTGGTPVIGSNAGFTVANPSGVTPVSATVLTTGSINTTATLPLKIMQLPFRPNVDFSANTPFIVRFNTHELLGSTAGV